MTRSGPPWHHTTPKCPLCGGWDVGAAGFIMHKRACPKEPCLFCGLEVQPTERRTIYDHRTAHLDCAVDFEHDRDKEQHG